MRLAIAADHNGRVLRGALREHLERLDHVITECGAVDDQATDYPPIVADLARRVLAGEVEQAIMVGGTGSGESIAANKIAGIRAVLCSDHLTARIGRENNDGNLLVLGSMVVGPRLASELAEVWVGASFQGGRHVPRLEQIAMLERGESLR